VIQGMSVVDGKIVVTMLEDVCSRIAVFDANGKLVDDIKLPTLGAVSAVNGNADGSNVFFAFESFAFPPSSFCYDLKSKKLDLLATVPIDIRPADYETKQVWFNSKDDTRVPMFLVFKKGLKMDGQRPTLLNGYGGFNVSSTPRFRNGLFPWLDKGCIYAVANIRGGGEFGAQWHHAGRLEKKQNCFDDFIAAAKYLTTSGITNPNKLAAIGGSNGGLLMGAMITQAPELFRAIICAVPLLDMIRYHQFSMARFWIQEYGSSEDASQFAYILKYSPYQNVKKGTKYPAVLIETGDSDGRVDPCHARKMAALLQADTGSDYPILLRYETKAGHGAGKPISKIVEAQADEWAFLMNELGVK
jgi:prolyl oligopeptidase